MQRELAMERTADRCMTSQKEELRIMKYPERGRLRSAFAAALYLGIRGGAETWSTATPKLLFYGLFVWLLHEQVGIR
jgi:hypothetical protein